MSKTTHVALFEDTINGGGNCRILAKPVFRFMEEIHGSACAIYWKSPCYSNDRPFATSPIYGEAMQCQVADSTSELVDCTNNYYKEQLFAHYTKPCPALDNFDDLLLLSYRNVNIGFGIGQWLLRTDPALNIAWTPSSHRINQWISLVKASLDAIHFMAEFVYIDALFLSDPVYLCNALVKWGRKHNILMPWIEGYDYNCMMPDAGCPNYFYGHSEFALGRQTDIKGIVANKQNRELEQSILIKEARRFIEARIRGANIHGESRELQVTATRYSLSLLMASPEFNTHNILYIDNHNIKHLREGNKDSHVYAVFYLHCFADAPLSEGYSGFRGSYDFYITMAANLANIIKDNSKATLLIRPHPFVGAQSCLYNGTKNSSPLELIDIKLTARLVIQIQEILQINSNIDLKLISNEISIRSLCTVGSRIIHFTHHGSVAEELAYLDQQVITSCVSPMASLGFGAYIIDHKSSSEQIIKTVIASTVNNEKIIGREYKLLTYIGNKYLRDRNISRAWGKLCQIIKECSDLIEAAGIHDEGLILDLKYKIVEALFNKSGIKAEMQNSCINSN